jgi:prepilin peptidase CpaA
MMIIPGLFLVAGFYDVLTTRIPDWTSLAIIAIFFLFAWLIGMSGQTLLMHIGIGILAFLIGFLLFAMGWVGGGDGKLAAAGALWFGAEKALLFISLSFIYGAILVGIIMILRMRFLSDKIKHWAWLNPWLRGQEGLPFGLAMAASVLSMS